MPVKTRGDAQSSLLYNTLGGQRGAVDSCDFDHGLIFGRR